MGLDAMNATAVNAAELQTWDPTVVVGLRFGDLTWSMGGSSFFVQIRPATALLILQILMKDPATVHQDL